MVIQHVFLRSVVNLLPPLHILVERWHDDERHADHHYGMLRDSVRDDRYGTCPVLS
jgi:hypothetical protein